jgi:hypothetical protein
MTEPREGPTSERDASTPGPSGKRQANTPLNEQKQKSTRFDQKDDNNKEEDATRTTTESEDTDGPMRNIVFPIYKLLRRQNTKLVVAQHHRTFLEKLREQNQAPKGLKVKVATTTVELPRLLYIKWETAHIELSNKLRDILWEYWTLQVQSHRNEIQDTIRELSSLCTQEELVIINSSIEKICKKKTEELTNRTNKKTTNSNRRSGTAGSANTNQ